MNRIAFMVIKNLVHVPGWFYRIWKLGRENDTHTDQERYDYLRKLIQRVNHSGRVTVIGSGEENLPKENGFIMFPNHQGLFDLLAIIERCPHPMRVIVKKEASGIILVKQVMELLKCIPMDRSDLRASLLIIQEMTKGAKAGLNYLIFPEGTRSREQNHILPFKAGSFKSAMNAHCPIVPVALIDSYRPFDISSIKKETVQVHFLEPIYYDQYVGMKSTEIADVVHDRIQGKIDEVILQNGLDNKNHI